MTNEEAIKRIELLVKGRKDKRGNTELDDALIYAIEVLKDRPTGWIPVSERLPDIHDYCMKYLVSDCYGHIHTSLFTESRGKSWWSCSDVKAWMPLPSPYKAESEVQDADSD